MECICCFNDIEEEVKYRDKPNGEWKECKYCRDCIEYMKQTQFNAYVKQIENETCKVSLERLINQGPPLKVREPKTLPCENPRSEVYEFNLFSSDLENVYPQEELEKYIESLNDYLTKMKI